MSLGTRGDGGTELTCNPAMTRPLPDTADTADDFMRSLDPPFPKKGFSTAVLDAVEPSA
jgi:hypothetical protein